MTPLPAKRYPLEWSADMSWRQKAEQGHKRKYNIELELSENLMWLVLRDRQTALSRPTSASPAAPGCGGSCVFAMRIMAAWRAMSRTCWICSGSYCCLVQSQTESRADAELAGLRVNLLAAPMNVSDSALTPAESPLFSKTCSLPHPRLCRTRRRASSGRMAAPLRLAEVSCSSNLSSLVRTSALPCECVHCR